MVLKLYILTLALAVIAFSVSWSPEQEAPINNELVCINTQRMEFHRKLLRAFPEFEGKEIYSYDLDKDKEAELFIFMENKGRENSRIRIMKKKGKKYEAVTELETMPGSFFNVRKVSLNGKEQQHPQLFSEKERSTCTPEEKVDTQLAVDFTYGGSGGYGATYIIFFHDRFDMVSTNNLSPYCARLEELKPGQWEILAREFVGGKSSDNLYIDTIYHWKGASSFTNVSTEYSEYYQKFIDSCRNDISSSTDAGRADDIEYIDSRTKGLISAWRISGSPIFTMGPEDTVKKYFSIVKSKDFAEAYVFLSNAWHQWQPYGKYIEDYHNAKFKMEVYEVKLFECYGDRASIDAGIHYYELDDSFIRSENVRYTLIQEDGIWKIDKGELIESGSVDSTQNNERAYKPETECAI
ncbi:MAG: hypothetical protein AB9903_09405 [Vulcanimicrobiota bacterium]